MKSSPLIQDINLFLDDKPSVYALRQQAKNALLSQGFPTPKTEEWKYTNINSLTSKNFIIDTTEKQCGHDCCSHHAKEDSPFIEIRFCRGKLHIEDYNLPQGLTITPLPLCLYESEYKKYLCKSYNPDKHPFAALNASYLEQGICIHVEKDTHIDSPILIFYNQTDSENLQLNIHNLIILQQNAKLEIIEKFFSSAPCSYFTNIVNEIYLKTNAKLNHYKIQKESPAAYHIALNAANMKNNASYKQYYLSHGAKLSREESLINLEEDNADAEVYSAYTAQKGNLTDITTNINHNAPNTTSNQYAKAVLEEDSSAVFQGKIHIAPHAVKTSGHQLHKALYLNDNANLSCKPELEIYADDVKCSHGASCGEINKEQLFYLTSKGISQEDAIQILTSAHLEEIFALITNDQIKDLFTQK